VRYILQDSMKNIRWSILLKGYLELLVIILLSILSKKAIFVSIVMFVVSILD